jgi:hypothetical protein
MLCTIKAAYPEQKFQGKGSKKKHVYLFLPKQKSPSSKPCNKVPKHANSQRWFTCSTLGLGLVKEN